MSVSQQLVKDSSAFQPLCVHMHVCVREKVGKEKKEELPVVLILQIQECIELNRLKSCLSLMVL